MKNLHSVLKSRDITLPTKIRILKAMVFPVVMYGCERWAVKKADGLRTDAFKLWWWGNTLECPLDSKEIKPVNSKGNQLQIFIGKMRWSWSSNTLTTWCEGLTHWTGGQRIRRQQRMIWLDSITDSMDMNVSKFWETVGDRGAWLAIVHGITKSQIWLSEWTTTKYLPG